MHRSLVLSLALPVLVVAAPLGGAGLVACGTDGSAYIYEWKNERWQRI